MTFRKTEFSESQKADEKSPSVFSLPEKAK